MEEYDMPPEPPIPEPIIPTALYYELPAGLMAPLVGVRMLLCFVIIMWPAFVADITAYLVLPVGRLRACKNQAKVGKKPYSILIIDPERSVFTGKSQIETLPWSRFPRKGLKLGFKAAKYEIQKPSTCRATLFRCKFWSMFPVFHLARSTWPATKTFVAGWRKLLRKAEPGSTLSKFCCSFFIKLTTCCATNLLVPEPINQSARCISSTQNKCFCCGSSWSRQVKNGKHRPKLATK